MSTFWGEGGQYGPYTLQKDGWPHAGQVMRDFRQKMGLSAEDAARLYSTALETQIDQEKGKKPGKAITASWIFSMENENRVPTHISRRRILADMLQIPYALFGLSPLSQIAFKVAPDGSMYSSSLIESVIEDTQRYDKEINLFWQLHYTNTAINLLNDIDMSILSLAAAEKISKGSLREHIYSLLNSYYTLGAEITRSTGALKKSYFYAENAIRIAKKMRQEHMIAFALYTRGYTSLVGGLFGEKDKTGSFKLDTQKLSAAINDFEQALPYARLQLKGFIWLELSRAYVYLYRSKSDVSIALEHLRRAKDAIGTWEIDNRLTSIKGVQKGLNEGMFLLGNAITLTALGRSEKALEDLDTLSGFKGLKGIERNQIRRQAWIDIVYAQASLSARNYYDATLKLTNAFTVCKEIYLHVNVDIIDSLCNQLLKTSYKNNSDLIELRYTLKDYYRMRKVLLQ